MLVYWCCNVMECICEILVGEGGRCNMMECICEILGGGQLGQVKSVDIKISFNQGEWPYFGPHTHTHMQDRLDKSQSALADARLKRLMQGQQ